MSANVAGASLGVEAAFMQAGPPPGASIGVEAAFAGADALGGGSVMTQAPGASMSVEAAFAAYAPAGGSLGLTAAGNGPSISVEAAFANAARQGLFNGSSLGVEAAFAEFAASQPGGGSLNLPGLSLGVDAAQFPLGFDGSSLFVEAAFMDPGPRRASGASCMVGAGASMAVEGAFSEVAPDGEKGPVLPPPQPQHTGLAAIKAAAEAGCILAQHEFQARAAQASASFTSTVPLEDSSLRVPAVSTPRRGTQPLSLVPPVQPSPTAAVASPVPRRPVQRVPPQASEQATAMVQPPGDVVRWRPGMASFRTAASPPRGGPRNYGFPRGRPGQEAAGSKDLGIARAAPPPMATASEVMAYPYMYHAPDLRFEAPKAANAIPTAEAVPARQFFDDHPYSYTGVPNSIGRDVPSYAPRALSSRYEAPSSASATPVQGLSVMHMPPGPGVAYPGPTRGSTVQFSTAVPYQGQAPVQVEAHAATVPSVPAASGPTRATPQKAPPPVIQHFNGSTARYAQSPVAPSSLMQSISMNTFNQLQMPTAPYTRPNTTPTQVPSFTAPASGHPQAPSYVQQVLPGAALGYPVVSPFGCAAPPFGAREPSAGGAGASLTAPSREGGQPQRMGYPQARLIPGYA